MKRTVSAIFSFFFLLSLSAQVPVMNPIAGPNSLCSGSGIVNYTASASNSPTVYMWNIAPSAGISFTTTSGGQYIGIQFPQITQTYTLYSWANNGSGASNVVSMVINVFETPSVTFSGSNTTFCQGSSSLLMASPTTQASSSTLSYIWFPSTGLSTTSTYSTIASPTVSTNYTVNVSLGPCTSTYVIPTTVLPPPVLSVVTTHAQLCSGHTATVTASGTAASYMVNNQPSPPTFTIAPVGTTTYVVTGIGQNGCQANQNFVQNVIPGPVIVVSSLPNPLCAGQTSTISLSGSPANYSVNSVGSPATFTMSPSATSTLIIRAENSNACDLTTSHVLTVEPTPTLTVSSTANPMCKGEVHTITITGNAVTYQVNSVSTPSSFTVSPAGTATYVVKGTGQYGCSTQMSFVQNVDLCVGLQKAERLVSGLLVYPNPSSGNLYIRSGTDTEARLYDQLGQQVRHLDLRKGEEATLTGLSEGVYFIVTGTQTTKLIITK